jgi:hypothetical protein
MQKFCCCCYCWTKPARQIFFSSFFPSRTLTDRVSMTVVLTLVFRL